MAKANARNLFVLVLWILMVDAVFSCTGCIEMQTDAPEQEAPIQVIKDITSKEALALIATNRNNPEFVIIDVRTPEEFAKGHIENAINIDFRSKTFRDDLDRLDKNKTYLIYCRSGRRSGLSIPTMKELDFRAVYHLLGGIIHWKAEDLPITR
jgi:rhodanese-related sulfurtransferase